MHPAIEHLQHARRIACAAHYKLAQRPDRQRAVERRCGSLAGHIPQSHGQFALAIGKKIVEVATKLSRGNIRGGEIKTRYAARAMRKQLALDLAGGIEVILKAGLILARLFVEPRVFKRHRNVRPQRREHALVLLGEGVLLGTLEIEDTDQTVL